MTVARPPGDGTTLRIGADGSWIRWQGGGLSRYLDELLHSMDDVLAKNERLIVYYNSARGERLFGSDVDAGKHDCTDQPC